MIQRLLKFKSFLLLSLFLEKSLLFPHQFIILSPEIGNLVFLIFNLIKFIVSKIRFNPLNLFLESIDLPQLSILIQMILLLQPLSLLNKRVVIGYIFLNDAGNDMIQFMYLSNQPLVLLNHPYPIQLGRLNLVASVVFIVLNGILFHPWSYI